LNHFRETMTMLSAHMQWKMFPIFSKDILQQSRVFLRTIHEICEQYRTWWERCLKDNWRDNWCLLVQNVVKCSKFNWKFLQQFYERKWKIVLPILLMQWRGKIISKLPAIEKSSRMLMDDDVRSARNFSWATRWRNLLI
jgi:hypothetical protein